MDNPREGLVLDAAEARASKLIDNNETDKESREMMLPCPDNPNRIQSVRSTPGTIEEPLVLDHD